MTLDPAWHKNIPAELKEKLGDVRVQLLKDEDGNAIAETSVKNTLFDLLATYKKDLRLGYIDKEELRRCEHKLNIAEDCLRLNCFRGFITAFSQVATVIELSQSKGGFIRKMQNTIITGETKMDVEPERSKFPYMKR